MEYRTGDDEVLDGARRRRSLFRFARRLMYRDIASYIADCRAVQACNRAGEREVAWNPPPVRIPLARHRWLIRYMRALVVAASILSFAARHFTLSIETELPLIALSVLVGNFIAKRIRG